MRLAARLFSLILFALSLATAARADEAAVRGVIAKFATAAGYAEIEAVIDELGVLGDPLGARSLNALNDGRLVVRKDDRSVLVTESQGGRDVLTDPVNGDVVAEAAGAEIDKVKIKNSIRRKIAAVLSGLTLMAKDPAIRLAAAEQIFAKPDPAQLEALETAIAAEKDPSVRTRMEEARAAIVLATSEDEAARVAAIAVISARGDRAALALLSSAAAGAQGAAADALAKAIASINRDLAWWDVGQNVWYGISLGSVLLLAAIGLAITFGVMGVINMAHGEMVMLGAYTTFVVQELFRTYAPHYFDHSLTVALVAAFLVAGAVGFAIERTIIRFLYGRPLETLLATWGVSLILQQAVRTAFGPTNREVGNPSWMTGAFQIGEIAITWNRLWIVVFALAVFAALLVAVNFTRMGLQMRAVTQNRRMAGAMGIATPRVDSLTFALGSAIAGIAGVALSQIDNVSPNLGQGYIIDSFMVVVFGGVGDLWGTLIGAMTLGVANKFLEPFAGAVFGKIIVLVLIILFIQRRPRGLFALRGRAIET
jgi:urea transport system permease protein